MSATDNGPERTPVSQRQQSIQHRLKRVLQRLPERVWYQGHWLGHWFTPLGWLYCGIARLRRWLYQHGWLASYSAPVPVIMVGNLSVGGTGKTPLVLWLAGYLAKRGNRPGIALRGYGRRPFDKNAPTAVDAVARGGRGASHSAAVGRIDDVDTERNPQATELVLEQPRQVPPDGEASQFGDEAVLLAQRAGCPVIVGRDRVAAANQLAEHCGCDLVITDDGLQHYRLRRQVEILVVDGERGFGNCRCLPAGPLREPVGRSRWVDLMIENGRIDNHDAMPDSYRMQLEPADAVSLVDPSLRRPLADFAGKAVTAVAGIGNPQRFFAMLRGFGLSVVPHPYPDHHRYDADDLRSWPEGPILMTEKDAVKCRAFADSAHWYVPVTAIPESRFIDALDAALDRHLPPTESTDLRRHARARAHTSC